MSATPPTAAAAERDRNRRLAIDHLEALVNQRDLLALKRDLTPDSVDHEGLEGQTVGRNAAKLRMAALHRRFPDLRIEVKDSVAEGDKVVLRLVWQATRPDSGRPVAFHGFVQLRFRDGKIAERWATITPFHEMAMGTPDW